MTNAPAISVVIPTHNRSRLLKEAVASVFAQTFHNWQLIIVDDASEDDTWSWLSQLDDSRVRKIRLEQHAERSVARNTGLQAATGEFILFLDDDDLLSDSALQVHLEALQRHPAAIASIGGYIMIHRSGTCERVRIVRRPRVGHIWQDILFGWMAVSGQCLFQTQAIRAVNGWNARYIPIEDHDLWLRVARLGAVVLLPDLVLMYRVHSGQWRPPKLKELITRVREHAARELRGSEREFAERILQARGPFRMAKKHRRHAETLRALASHVKTIRTAPSLLRSPLTRPMLLEPMMKCILAGVGTSLRRLSFLPSRQRSRAVDLSVSRMVDPTGDAPESDTVKGRLPNEG